MNALKPIVIGTLFSLLTSANAPASEAEMVDRVGFPKDYASTLTQLSFKVRTEKPEIITVFGNDLATSITDASKLPYPNGTIIVMEWASAAPSAQGHAEDASRAPATDARSHERKGDVVRIDVMRRGPDFGAAYGESRAGNWEFMSYRADGTALGKPADFVKCAACHAKAGADKDFVFRLRVPTAQLGSRPLVLTVHPNAVGSRHILAGRYEAALSQLAVTASGTLSLTNRCVVLTASRNWESARPACDAAVESALRNRKRAWFKPAHERVGLDTYAAVAYANRAVMFLLSRDVAAGRTDLQQARTLRPQASFVTDNLATMQALSKHLASSDENAPVISIRGNAT